MILRKGLLQKISDVKRILWQKAHAIVEGKLTLRLRPSLLEKRERERELFLVLLSNCQMFLERVPNIAPLEEKCWSVKRLFLLKRSRSRKMGWAQRSCGLWTMSGSHCRLITTLGLYFQGPCLTRSDLLKGRSFFVSSLCCKKLVEMVFVAGCQVRTTF